MNQPIRSFADSLNCSIAFAERLEALLLEETAAVARRASEQLRHIVDEKRSIIKALELETEHQKEQIRLYGHAFDRHGFEAFIHAQTNASELMTCWRKLRAIITRCHRINDGNAHAVERAREHVSMALHVLRDGEEAPSTYTPKGKTQPVVARSRTISQA
jgi:flagellar biosynthesis/type III secretory pathway chaperone